MRSLSLFLLLALSAAGAAEKPLPRVLILGDSVYMEPAQAVAMALKGRVEVIKAVVSPGDTATALGQLDKLLGTGQWDLIHFNFGITDLLYKAPGIKSIRAMSKSAGGVRVTTPVQYEKNLRELVKRLKVTGAKLVWASTTPIGTPKFDNIFDLNSEIEYNAIAARIMTEEAIPINDLHALVLANTQGPADPTAATFKRSPLHPPIVEIILRELKVP